MVLLLPILVPLIGGIFVFRQKSEQLRDRLALTVILATAVLAAVACLLPERRLVLLTIQGALHLALRTDGLARFFMLLCVCIWVPVLLFAFPISATPAGSGSSWGSTP